MVRGLLVLVCAYGFALSRSASRNIIAMSARAARGDIVAQQHFTQTRYARVFGVRNSDIGMVYYSILGWAALSGWLYRPRVTAVALWSAIGSMLFSLYLLWALFVRLRVACKICLMGHTSNAITLLLLLAVRSGRR